MKFQRLSPTQLKEFLGTKELYTENDQEEQEEREVEKEEYVEGDDEYI